MAGAMKAMRLACSWGNRNSVMVKITASYSAMNGRKKRFTLAFGAEVSM
jgi:hypothetical protein